MPVTTFVAILESRSHTTSTVVMNERQILIAVADTTKLWHVTFDNYGKVSIIAFWKYSMVDVSVSRRPN